MTDISRILDGLFADLGSDEASSLPALPAALPAKENLQNTDIVETPRTSRTSRMGNEAARKADVETSSNARVSAEGSRVTSSYAGGAGSAGSAGSAAKTLAGSTSPSFPQDLEDAGSAGSKSGSCGRPLLDLNRAAASPSGTTLPISPEKVRAGVERELRALADLGRTGPDAERDAVAITRAKIRNSEVLAKRQVHDGFCHVCVERLDDALPVVAILTGKRGQHLYLHFGCHEEHSRRVVALVDRIMVAAGYGAGRQGEAA